MGGKIFLKPVNVLIFIITLACIAACKEKDPESEFDKLDILDKLKTLEGVTVAVISPQNGYKREFQLDITQPVDHNNPGGASFTQRAYLSHNDEAKPMVFAPNGYGASASSSQEIALLLQTNCLNVTHRYFVGSRPSPADWQYLTIKQSADDHHRIVELLKKIYKGKWISAGASKSGMTALFHRRYYPDDVDVTIASVAPFSFGIKDERFPVYLRNIGGSDCFSKLMKVQQYVLNHRTEFISFINNYIQTSGAAYSLDPELILELNIMDYPFTFWQYFNISCASIPDTTTSTSAQIFSHYSNIVPISSFSDGNLSYFEPYAYQAITELGAPAYETGYLSNYLKKIDPDAEGNPNYELVAPAGVSCSFNGSAISDIYTWLQDYGDRIIYIYGKNDPWSAGAIELTGSADAILIMQEGANHKVKIADLDNPDVVYNALRNWLGIEILINTSEMMNKSISSEREQGFRLGF